MAEKNGFKVQISSKRRAFDLHLGETFGYRDLILLFVKRDFTAQYKQTVLGPLWAIIQPLLTTVVFTFVFGRLAHLTTADTAGFAVPGFLFYLAGSICWSYFSATLSAASNTFISNRHIMSKVYFPRLAAPVASALSHLISFFIQLLLFAVVWAIYYIKGGSGIRLTPWLLMIPLVILQMMALSVGFGIIISSVTTKYRDLIKLVGFGLQLWHYASPVAYGLQLVPQKYAAVYMLNPMAPALTAFRLAVFGTGYFDLTCYLIGWAVSIAVLFAGLLLFGRVERTFADTV